MVQINTIAYYNFKTEHVIQRSNLLDFQDVKGQDAVVKFIVAATGGHNLIIL